MSRKLVRLLTLEASPVPDSASFRWRPRCWAIRWRQSLGVSELVVPRSICTWQSEHEVFGTALISETTTGLIRPPLTAPGVGRCSLLVRFHGICTQGDRPDCGDRGRGYHRVVAGAARGRRPRARMRQRRFLEQMSGDAWLLFPDLLELYRFVSDEDALQVSVAQGVMYTPFLCTVQASSIS